MTLVGDYHPAGLLKRVTAVGAHRFRCRCGAGFGERTSLKCVLAGTSVSCGCARVAAAKERGRAKRGKYSDRQWAAAKRRYSIKWVDLVDRLGRDGCSPLLHPADESVHTRYEVSARCKCGNPYTARATDVMRGFVRSCGCVNSHVEMELAQFVQSLDPGAVRNTRKVIPPFELDVWVPSAGLGVELNGLYWHGERHKGAAARIDISRKLEPMTARGHRLVVVYEDEWRLRRTAVEGYLRAILGRKPTVGARECLVVEDHRGAQAFEEAHHVQGAATRGERLVLTLAGRVVAVATFAPVPDTSSRSAGPGTWDLVRYTVGPDLSVAGGLSRLLARWRRAHPGPVVTYSDKRWSAGNLYRAAGFQEGVHSVPRYWYFRKDDPVRRHRFAFRKAALVQKGWLRPGETEWACMRRLGWDRVWDAGKVRWVLP